MVIHILGTYDTVWFCNRQPSYLAKTNGVLMNVGCIYISTNFQKVVDMYISNECIMPHAITKYIRESINI